MSIDNVSVQYNGGFLPDIIYYNVALPGDDVLCWLLSCPFPSVCFPCFFAPTVLFPVRFGLVPSVHLYRVK